MHQRKKSKGIYLLWIPFIAVLLSWAACNQKENTPGESPEIANEKPVDATEVDQMPEMEGGMEALMTFLSKEIIYPESQKAAGVEAKVLVQFTVMAEGSIADVVALPGKEEVAKEFSDEAIRAVMALPKWKPGMKDGKAVSVQLVLPIQFSL
ncbi:MAG: energy transducer TonB [Bacteroidia bacterium]